MAEKGRVLTGARARFLLDGKKVGYASGVSIGEEIDWQELAVLDNIEVEEHVPLGYRVTPFTARRFRLVGETLKSEGFFPKTGTSPEEHLRNILAQGELTATIEDSRTGKIIQTVEGVRIASKGIDIDARQAVGKNITFVAIRAKDESEVT